jgi:hypothetical protein
MKGNGQLAKKINTKKENSIRLSNFEFSTL